MRTHRRHMALVLLVVAVAAALIAFGAGLTLYATTGAAPAPRRTCTASPDAPPSPAQLPSRPRPPGATVSARRLRRRIAQAIATIREDHLRESASPDPSRC